MGTTERRLRERARKESDIINVAKELFLAKSYQDTTVDDIADRLEVSKGAIYLHFRSKEEIYFAVGLRWLQILRDKFEEAVSGPGTGLERLEQIGNAYVDFWSTHADYRKLFHNASVQVSPGSSGENSKKFAILGAEMNEMMARVVREGIKDGSIYSNASPEQIAFITSSSVDGVLSRLELWASLQKGAGMEREIVLERTFELFIRALAAIPCEESTKSSASSTAIMARKSRKKPSGRDR